MDIVDSSVVQAVRTPVLDKVFIFYVLFTSRQKGKRKRAITFWPHPDHKSRIVPRELSYLSIHRPRVTG